MAMQQDVLGTEVCPRDFAEAARRHGRHFARYLLAVGMARGRRVLDAACGSGFGSAYLATAAESVLGADLDERMLELARANYAGPNLRFLRHDLHEPLPAGETFDLVCSFETLEHVRDPRAALAVLAAALDDDGVAMVSVPNGAKELRDGRRKEYHQTHFSAGELAAMLDERFEAVEPFSQVYRKGPGHYARKLLGRGGHHARGYRFEPGFADTAKTWLAVCRGPRR
jgi:2-polyprenyl-3-methyl-5-hydroxy-6-metoxy-1,4-benzoquinol methylase